MRCMASSRTAAGSVLQRQVLKTEKLSLGGTFPFRKQAKACRCPAHYAPLCACAAAHIRCAGRHRRGRGPSSDSLKTAVWNAIMRRTAIPQQSLIEIWSEKKSEFKVMRTMQRGSRGVTGLLHRKRPRRPRASRGRTGVDLDSSSFEVVGTRDMVHQQWKHHRRPRAGFSQS